MCEQCPPHSPFSATWRSMFALRPHTFHKVSTPCVDERSGQRKRAGQYVVMAPQVLGYQVSHWQLDVDQDGQATISPGIHTFPHFPTLPHTYPQPPHLYDTGRCSPRYSAPSHNETHTSPHFPTFPTPLSPAACSSTPQAGACPRS